MKNAITLDTIALMIHNIKYNTHKLDVVPSEEDQTFGAGDLEIGECGFLPVIVRGTKIFKDVPINFTKRDGIDLPLQYLDGSGNVGMFTMSNTQPYLCRDTSLILLHPQALSKVQITNRGTESMFIIDTSGSVSKIAIGESFYIFGTSYLLTDRGVPKFDIATESQSPGNIFARLLRKFRKPMKGGKRHD